MKKLQAYFLVALLVVGTACSLFKKDIDVPQSFSIDISRSATDPLQFTTTYTLNTTNEDVEEYKDNIDEFRIDRITYKVSDFSGSNTPVVSGTLKFAADGTSAYKTLGTISGLDLKASNTSGQEYTMDIASEAVRNELVNLMKAGTTVNFMLDASSTNNPVDATIDFKIYANMTVEL
ncbi:hypothetical protein [Botryobacter ruber]|uniref:hypothetical protein n=1 Tax=Botryobacter ruber TaxID=2171629 RepID=UPI000E0CB4F9|nr:hypothetical protein [Botryobacter ruber]